MDIVEKKLTRGQVLFNKLSGVIERTHAMVYPEMMLLRSAALFAECNIHFQLQQIPDRLKEEEQYQWRDAEGNPIMPQRTVEEESRHLTDVLGPIFWRSFLVAFYSHFEWELDRHCQDLADVLGVKLRPKDVSGRGIYRSKLFLDKVAQTPIPVGPTWTDITTYGKIRNAIVHRGGLITNEERPAVQALLARTDGRIDEKHIVQIGPRTLESLVTAFHHFWDALLNRSLSAADLENRFV